MLQLLVVLSLWTQQVGRERLALVHLTSMINMIISLDCLARVGQVSQGHEEVRSIILDCIIKLLPQSVQCSQRVKEVILTTPSSFKAATTAAVVLFQSLGPPWKLPAHAHNLKGALAKHRFLGFPVRHWRF